VQVGRGAPQETTNWVLANDRSQFLPEEIFPPAASNEPGANLSG